MKGIQLLQRGYPRMVKHWPRTAAMVAVAAMLPLVEGCAERRPRGYPWATAIRVRPRTPLAAPGYTPPSVDDSAPQLPWNVAPPPARVVVRQPLRPRSPAQITPEPAGSAKTEPPSLAPQLSQQEVAAAQQQMNESISVAQQNLSATKGHRLNPVQADLASKVNSFLDESKGAVKDGDWTRAKNLAKKAQVLSEELASSL